MRAPLLAGFLTTVGPITNGSKLGSRKARLLAAGASVLAIGAVSPAEAQVVTDPGVRQEDFGSTIAINLYDVGESDPDQVFGTTVIDNNPGGVATATAEVLCAGTATCDEPGALEQSAWGTESAENHINISGSQTIRAQGNAEGGVATAIGFMDLAVGQLAVAPEHASNEITIGGLLDLHAGADAHASSGEAFGLAGIQTGIWQVGSAGYDGGTATNAISVDGELSIVADARAQADNGYATAGAYVGVGIYQEANGIDLASNSLMNSGDLTIHANASAVAGQDMAFASASAVGIVQVAEGRTQAIVNSTLASGTLVGEISDTPTGQVSAQITNVGQLGIGASAHALGQGDALAVAGATGIAQIVSGSDSLISLDNFGSVDIGAMATATGVGTPRAIAIARGIAQFASGVEFTTLETINPYGTAAFEGSAVPVGTASVQLNNSGDITIHADVDAFAHASTSGGSTEAFGYAGATGVAQTAIAADASALFGNGGSFLVSAVAHAESEGVANAVVAASGIDQIASAVAVHQTVVFASGTTTPTFFTGSSEGVGPAAVALENAGALTVVALGSALGDEMALAGATAAGVGQGAYGQTASASLTNSGTIATLAKAHSQGDLALAGAGAVGLTQVAVGTADAHASIVNGGDLLVSAWGEGVGEVAGFANASAIGVVQNAIGSGPASVDFLNSAVVNVQALGTATGGVAAGAFALADGLLQRVDAAVAEAHFTNDGLFKVIAEAHADASAYATAAATILAGVSQSATVGATGFGELSVNNSGSLLVGALAEATADAAAYATAAIMGGVLQSVTGGGGSISFDNSGSLDILAVANANAMGSEEADIAYANALAVGNFAKIGPYITATTPTGTGTTGGTTAIMGATVMPGAASIAMTNDGALHVDAVAHASADGNALAFATALYGMVGQAVAAGDVDISLINHNDLRVSAKATAVGGHAGTAIAQAIGGLVAAGSSTGTGDAFATVENSGSIIVRADAHADATTNAWAGALGVTGVWEVAHAAQGNASVNMTNSGSIDVIGNAVASGLVAQATAVGGAGGIFGGAILQSAAASMGDAYGHFNNGGEINVVANASADGSVIAYANAYGGPGVIQRVWSGGVADADVGNSGSISVISHADAYATNSAIAHAENLFGIMAVATGVEQAGAGFANSGTVTIAAAADAHGPAWGTADALLNRALVVGARANDGEALAELTNSGSFTVGVSASGEGELAAATAAMIEGIVEQATSVGSAAHAGFENSGEMAFVANAVAATVSADGYGTALAAATAFNAIAQQAIGMAQTTPSFAVGDASVEFGNSGTIEVGVHASVEGEAVGNAAATLSGGIVQNVYTGQFAPAYSTAPDILGSASLVNDGYVTMVASAEAEGSSAVALANVIAGISQAASAALGDAALGVTNDGSIVLHAGAEASGGETFSRANAVVYGAFFQSADAATGSANVGFENAGDFEVTAGAKASGEELVVAFAQALGGNQEALAGTGGTAVAAFENGGDYVIHAAAQATLNPADDATGVTFANAGAQASGLYQFSNNGSVSFVNSGTFDVAAGAHSEGPQADGFAMALGVSQGVAGTDGAVSFANDGNFSVEAGFEGEGQKGTGFVVATGYRASGEALSVDVENGGDMSIVASAEGVDGASAGAVGIAIQAAVATSAPVAALLDGIVDNGGDLAVLAFASGGTVTTGTGTTAHEVPGSNATATGMALLSGVNTMTVSNSGSIAVDAVTGHGGNANAYGIRVAGNGTGVAAGETDIFTINSSGDIIVRVSSDGGDSWQRGMAIDVAEAPNPTVINLLGGGKIYGNVDLQSGDEIIVADGETSFNGIINPESASDGEAALAELDPPLVDEGSLTIADGGTLLLRNTASDGPSSGFLETLEIAHGGTLAVEVLANDEDGTATYGQLFTDVATLEGTIEARLHAGLYDSMTLDNVVDANTLAADAVQCVLAGDYADSLFFSADCVADAQANLDVRIVRTAFDEIDGLEYNAYSAAEGLECIYDTDLTGGIADLVEDLFLIEDADDFNNTMHMLAGESYAQYLQSFQSLGVHYNDILDRATDCEVPTLIGSALACRTDARFRTWGQLDQQWRNVDGDHEAGDYKSRRMTGLTGVDAKVADDALVGASLGLVNNHVRDHRFGDNIDADGWQAGLYGVYDPGAFYLKGQATYSWFDGDSRRHIDLDPFGGSFSDTTRGDPDVKLWTIGLHGGARLPIGNGSVLTPYLNVDYVHASLDGFIETGDGANLHLANSSESRAWSTVGGKWATQIDGVVPEVNLGYRFRFGDTRSTVEAAFDCQIETCGFDVLSSAEKRGTFLAGVTVGGKVGRVDLRLGYQGEYNGDVTSHSGSFRIAIPLGHWREKQ